MRTKLQSLDAAAASVQAGSLLGMTSAVLDNAPMAFLRALVKRQIGGLGLVTLTGGGLNADLLIGAGLIDSYETCSCTLGPYGPAPNFQRAVRAGLINMKDSTWGVLYSMIQAGSMGLPFVAVRGLLGSDMLTYRPDLLVQDNPFKPGEQVVVAQPIRPDVAVFHALHADRWGNAITPGPRDDVMLARAARRVIVTAETVVDTRLTPADAPHDTFLPAIDVDVVAEAPLGAHPCGLGRLYEHDPDHCRTYLAAAAHPHEFRAYLDRYVFGAADHAVYLSRVDDTRQAGV